LYKFFNLLLELKKKHVEKKLYNCWNEIEKANVIVCSCGGEKKEKFAFRLFEPIQDKKGGTVAGREGEQHEINS